MIPHLLLLWCAGIVDPALDNPIIPTTCTQEMAYKIIDAGEAPENDYCSAATARWIVRREYAVAADAEALWIVCEVPR